MSDSLRDQLLQLGFKAPARPKDEQRRGAGPGRPRKEGVSRGDRPAQGAQSDRGKGRPQERRGGTGAPGRKGPGKGSEMDLARAYAMRQQAEKAERQREEQARQEEARRKREARQALAQLLEGKAQNVADAELPRHFEFGGKIRRVYVTDAQFKAINAGELGVVQLAGRYLVVDRAVARDAAAILPAALALLVDPDAPEGGDEYADPRYRVPDDLVW